MHFQHRVGDQLVLPRDGGNLFTARIGFLITTGSTADLARARAEQAAGSLTVEVSQAADANTAA
jgi:hypothetical protein